MSSTNSNGRPQLKRAPRGPHAASLRPANDSPARPAGFDSNDPRGRLARFSLAVLLLCALSVAARAQTTDARLSVVSLDPPRLKIEGRRAVGARAWSFRNAYAGSLGLAERIENLSLADEQGARVAARKLAAGEYEAERAAVNFSYEIKLDPPAANNLAAHVSWLTPARGLLMPGDLLPLPLGRARLRFTLPVGWRLASLDQPTDGKTSDRAGAGSDAADAGVDAADAESAVVLVGPDVRRLDTEAGGMKLAVSIAGDWAFSDRDLLEVLTPIIKEHARATGRAPLPRAHVILAPFPRDAAPGQWAAETRGGTVAFLSARTPARQSALARLGDPLVHELFHLWIPNALNLSGEYDWFYEGFTLYQSLRAGQRLGRLTFDDFLGALARSYDLYMLARGSDELSLVEASSRRWLVAAAIVYQKGMLAAFLYDLNVRQRTGNKRSLEDVYRDLFRPRASRPADGNAAAVEALNDALGDPSFAETFVKAPRRIDLGAELSPFGLRVLTVGGRTRIVVAESLTGPQRALLRQIGYN